MTEIRQEFIDQAEKIGTVGDAVSYIEANAK